MWQAALALWSGALSAAIAAMQFAATPRQYPLWVATVVLALLAIMAGAIGTCNWFGQRKRKRNLILFPEDWTAQRNLEQNLLICSFRFRILAPHFSWICVPTIRACGKRLITQNHGRPHYERESITVIEFSSPLDQVPGDASEITAAIQITLDDGTKKHSKDRKVPIGIWPQSRVKNPRMNMMLGRPEHA
jgi:hypothetical protein